MSPLPSCLACSHAQPTGVHQRRRRRATFSGTPACRAAQPEPLSRAARPRPAGGHARRPPSRDSGEAAPLPRSRAPARSHQTRARTDRRLPRAAWTASASTRTASSSRDAPNKRLPQPHCLQHLNAPSVLHRPLPREPLPRLLTPRSAPGLAGSPSRQSRESLKTPTRADSRVALNKTESL